MDVEEEAALKARATLGDGGTQRILSAVDPSRDPREGVGQRRGALERRIPAVSVGKKNTDVVVFNLQLTGDALNGEQGVVVAVDELVGPRVEALGEPGVGSADGGEGFSGPPEALALPGFVEVTADDDAIDALFEVIEETHEVVGVVSEPIGAVTDAEVKIADDGDTHKRLLGGREGVLSRVSSGPHQRCR